VAKPSVGRFLQVDPVEGGSCNDYDYTCGEPVNGSDLSGTVYDPDSRGGGGVSGHDSWTSNTLKNWCGAPSHWRLCADALAAMRIAIDMTVARFGSRGGRGVGDAYLHFIWMGIMSYWDGYSTAVMIGTMHEDYPGNSARHMALTNNALGAGAGAAARLFGIRGDQLLAFLNWDFALLWNAGEFEVQECAC
jgi:hypothetical protein